MLLNKLLYCTVKNGRTQPFGLLVPHPHLWACPDSHLHLQNPKNKGHCQRNMLRWTTNSESCLLIFFGGVRKNAQHPHFDAPKNLQCTSDYESNVWKQSPNVERADCVRGIQLIPNSPQLDNAPLVYFTDTDLQKLQVDVIPPKLKHYFLMSWTSLFRNTKEYSLLISFKNGLYGKNASFKFKDGIPFPNQLARNEWWAPTAMCTQTTPFQSFFESPQPWG